MWLLRVTRFITNALETIQGYYSILYKHKICKNQTYCNICPNFKKQSLCKQWSYWALKKLLNEHPKCNHVCRMIKWALVVSSNVSLLYLNIVVIHLKLISKLIKCTLHFGLLLFLNAYDNEIFLWLSTCFVCLYKIYYHLYLI